jgi:hypothetical protein
MVYSQEASVISQCRLVFECLEYLETRSVRHIDVVFVLVICHRQSLN